MSTKLCHPKVPNLNNENDVFESIKLPPIFMESFTFSNSQVECKKCKITLKPKANDILFHITVCNGSLVEEKINSILKFNCLICNFKTEQIVEWKHHLFETEHVTNSFSSTEFGCSYICNLCDTHFYGFKDAILQHKCRPKSLSNLSDLMTYVYKNFKVQQKNMLYYCADCSHHSYFISNLHTNKHCKTAKNSTPFVCYSCKITFYESSGKTYFNHKASFEHTVFWCLNGDRTAPETPDSALWKLPLCITKYFVLSSLLKQSSCVVCYERETLSYKWIYNHFKLCIASKEISVIDECTPLKAINCDSCHYQYSGSEKEVYNCWVNHVVSLEHLSNSILKEDDDYLYTYYCYVTETVLFGTSFFVQEFVWKTNWEIDRLLFVSEFMADVYRRSNKFSNYSALHCCGICLYYTDSKYCEHKHDGSFPSLYCSSCLVTFNIESDFNEHLVSSEHIILKYFKPNESGKLKFLHHSSTPMKTCKSNLNEINDDQEISVSFSNQRSNDDSIYLSTYSSVQQDTSIELCSPVQTLNKSDIEINTDILSGQPSFDSNRKTFLDYIARLSAKSNKSALNNFLRKKFELLVETPYEIVAFSKLKPFFCGICDIVFTDEFLWSKHDKEFHKNIPNLSVFFCSICYVYCIDTYISINDHVGDIEHRIMLDFQKYLKIKTNVPPRSPITNTINSTKVNDSEKIKNEQDVKPKMVRFNNHLFIEITSKFILETFFVFNHYK